MTQRHSSRLGPRAAALPGADRPMLVRPRLLERLRSRWFARVTVVSAPAGYGKTTLLTQAIDANRSVPLGIDCWVPCGHGTGGAVAAVTPLGAALCAAVGAAVPQNHGGVDGLVEAVSEAVWRRSPDHVALVVDDVHTIPPGSPAATLLAALVDALPANGHLVLAGREPPPVPLARLEVEGRVVRLGESELAFVDRELADFAELRVVAPSRLRASGGWPALAELSASTRSGPGDRTATAAADYVGQEVLAGLAPLQRRHLALLANLGPFDDELAGAALGVDDVDSVDDLVAAVDVDELLRGLPLVTAVGGGVRALHPLWRRVLADEVGPAELAESRRRAAGLLLERSEPGRAVPLLLDAAAGDELGSALVVQLGAAHTPVPRDVLAEWYGRLPAEVRTGLAGRLLAAVLLVETDPEEAWSALESCAAAFRDAGLLAGEAACLAQLARLAWWSDDPGRLAFLAGRVAALEAEGCEEAVALACVARSLIHDLQNDCRQMLVELDKVVPGSLGQRWQGVASWLRSLAFLQLGDADSALTAAEHALTHAGDLHTPLAESTRVQALWFGGRPTDALDAVPALLERVEETGHRGHLAIGTAQCSVAYSLVGDRARAEACLARARAAAAAPDAPVVDTNLSIATAALAVLGGDEAAASDALVGCLARHPLRQGLSAGAHLRNLALLYVLAPETRPTWDDTDLGPAFLTARDLARAVTAVRERRLPADTPPLPPSGVVQAHLPLPWIAQLAVAAVDAGRIDGWRLLEDTWPATRPAVTDLATSGGTGGRDGGRIRGAARKVLGRLPVPPTGHYELRLLGPVELRRDGALVDAPEWRRERVRAMLAYLVLHGTVSRKHLAEELWPDSDADAQSRNLRVNLTYLLRILEPDRERRDVSFFVRQHGGNLTLHHGEWLHADVWDLDTLCQQATAAEVRGQPATVLDRGLEAAELWRAEPVEPAAEPWSVVAIEQCRRRYTDAVTRASELLLAQGNAARAIATAERALAADPWAERAHRLVVAAHQASHDDLAARRAVGRYRQAVIELGIGANQASLMAQRLLDGVPGHA